MYCLEKTGRGEDTMMRHVTKPELIEMRKELQEIKSNLYGESMHKLLQAEMDESDINIKRYLAESAERFIEVFVEVKVKGISATEYFAWQSAAMREAIMGTDEERMLQ